MWPYLAAGESGNVIYLSGSASRRQRGGRDQDSDLQVRKQGHFKFLPQSYNCQRLPTMDDFPNQVSKLVQCRFHCLLPPTQSALDPSLHYSQCSPGHFYQSSGIPFSYYCSHSHQRERAHWLFLLSPSLTRHVREESSGLRKG